jgi:hypothetical protein
VLQKVWDENWDGLGSQHESVERIDASLDDMREATLGTLRALD